MKNEKKHSLLFVMEIVSIIVLLVTIIFVIRDITKPMDNTFSVDPTILSSDEKSEIITINMKPIEEIPTPTPVLVETVEDVTVDNKDEEEASNSQDMVKIVVFGDSIWAPDTGTDSVADYLSEMVNAKIYNCAIGGTAAAVVNDESTFVESWESCSVNGMVYAATGRTDADKLLINHPETLEELKKIDFNDVDYFILSYGLNDYFSNVPIFGMGYYDLKSYIGALSHAVRKLKEDFPQAEVIAITPTYCQYKYYEEVYDDSNTKDYGQGPLTIYVDSLIHAGQELNIRVIDAYNTFDINYNTGHDYLLDGIHLTDAGKKQYATKVAEYLNELIPSR